jgi:hypothetical protein
MTHKNVLLTAVGLMVLAAGVATPGVDAAQLEEAEVFMEINDTDGDAGIQIFLDGEGWDTMQMKAPNGTVLFSLVAERGIAIQGLTELFFESAEPSFDEQPLEDFLELFPPGQYKFRGTTTEDEVITGKAKFTHKIPDAPEIISPEEESTVEPDNVVVEWERVPSPPGSRIVGYQVIVEKDEGTLRVFSADVDKNTTRVTVPPEFMKSGFPYKAEVIAIEKTGNKTISEIEFETE